MKVINMENTGRKIKEIRELNNTTIQDICDACGITKVAVHKWQKGICLPTLDNLIVLADMWNVMIDDLIVTEIIG